MSAIVYKFDLQPGSVEQYKQGVNTGEGSGSAINLPDGVDIILGDNIVNTIENVIRWIKVNWKLAALGALAILLLIRR